MPRTRTYELPAPTEIAFVLDRSGSMEAMRAEAIGGFNAFVEGQRREPGAARLTLALFDHEYDLVHDGAALADIPPLTAEAYVPRGTTALLDAVGRTVDDVQRRLARAAGPPPASVVVAVLTDGQENASRDYTAAAVRARIRERTERDGWRFVFLGAGVDAWATAEHLGIGRANAVAFEPTPAGVGVAFAAACRAVSARRTPRMG